MTKTNWWAARDERGLVHAALVKRFYDDRGRDDVLIAFQVSTACAPSVRQSADRPRLTNGQLPPMRLQNLTLVEYNVHEAPTCVRCACLAVRT